MAHQNRITCDFCNAEKLATNHWIMLLIDHKTKKFSLEAWNERLVKTRKHICGERCTLVAVSQIVSSWNTKGEISQE